MTRTNLINTDRELRIDDQVQDGRASARVVETDRGITIEYDNGDTLWLDENRFVWDESDGWVVV